MGRHEGDDRHRHHSHERRRSRYSRSRSRSPERSFHHKENERHRRERRDEPQKPASETQKVVASVSKEEKPKTEEEKRRERLEAWKRSQGLVCGFGDCHFLHTNFLIAWRTISSTSEPSDFFLTYCSGSLRPFRLTTTAATSSPSRNSICRTSYDFTSAWNSSPVTTSLRHSKRRTSRNRDSPSSGEWIASPLSRG